MEAGFWLFDDKLHVGLQCLSPGFGAETVSNEYRFDQMPIWFTAIPRMSLRTDQVSGSGVPESREHE